MQSSDPTYPLYPIMAFLGFILSLVPLPIHLQAWNSGTCANMFWTSLACLVKSINSIVWAGNINDTSPVWCDISSNFLLGAGVGIPASMLCTSRRLYTIASLGASSKLSLNKRRMLIVDLCIAFGLPILVMILRYIVQNRRYAIFEDVGCYPSTYNTMASYFLVHLWPVAIGSVSFVYSALAFHALSRRRSQFIQLKVLPRNLSMSWYIRVMVLCLIDMVLTVPYPTARVLITVISSKSLPYISWANVHSQFWRVDFFPASSWRMDKMYAVILELNRWYFVVSALLFFGLFGSGSDVRAVYKDGLRKFWKKVVGSLRGKQGK